MVKLIIIKIYISPDPTYDPSTTVQATDPQAPPPIRKLFPETWLFSNITEYDFPQLRIEATQYDSILSPLALI